MSINTVQFFEVTLPDGTRAWFESKETAESVCKVVETIAGFNLTRKVVSDAKPTKRDNCKKPRMTGRVEGIPTEEECSAVAKSAPKRKVAKTATPPLLTAKKANDEKSEAKSKATNARGYVFAERTCGVCGNKFTPRSGRQKVCDTCKKQGWKTCKSADTPKDDGASGDADDGAAEVAPKPEATKRRGRPPKNNGVVSDALAEVRKLAREAHLGPFANDKDKNGEGNE